MLERGQLSIRLWCYVHVLFDLGDASARDIDKAMKLGAGIVCVICIVCMCALVMCKMYQLS